MTAGCDVDSRRAFRHRLGPSRLQGQVERWTGAKPDGTKPCTHRELCIFRWDGGGAMLNVVQHGAAGDCDGVTRRSFLQAGALAIGGLSLADVLRCRAESPAPGRPRQKSVIMVHLSGGPSHLDMY